jgi:hypothetical protein
MRSASPSVLKDGHWEQDDRGIQHWIPARGPVPKPTRPEVRGPYRKRSKVVIDADEFRADWDAGLTVRELAAKYDSSLGRISETARRLGCPYRMPGRRKKP